MTFQPVLPFGGNLGWSFLTKTRAAQQQAFSNSAATARDTQYFRDKVADVRSAADLVADRRLLSVALGAFGLGDDINNRFFVRKVLEEGTLDPKSFANRLADKRYLAMAESFGFDLSPPNTVLSDFPDRIIDAYLERSFEVAVGNQDENLRLALGFQREMEHLAERELGETATWFTIMGTPPLRKMFEGALGLPAQLGALDIDRQLEIFREKFQSAFGTSNALDVLEDDRADALTRRFLLRSDAAGAGPSTSSASVALSLLQSRIG